MSCVIDGLMASLNSLHSHQLYLQVMQSLFSVSDEANTVVASLQEGNSLGSAVVGGRGGGRRCKNPEIPRDRGRSFFDAYLKHTNTSRPTISSSLYPEIKVVE